MITSVQNTNAMSFGLKRFASQVVKYWWHTVCLSVVVGKRIYDFWKYWCLVVIN